MRIKLLLLLTLFTSALLAQRPQGKGIGKRGGPAIVKGIVIEKETKNPLEFASVTLKSQKDSSIITGAMTMTDGSFEIKTRPGRFFAEVEFIGFETKVINGIQVKPSKTADLGQIEISSGAVLEEVNIVAEKSEMQFSLDKRVFNVGKDLSSTGGNAQDLLDNIPSVTVGVEGEVELRGNSNVRILVNGRPSGLVGIGDTEGLRNIPASMIGSVEVITNPSAKYEAEGMTGIINIVLKEERKGGFNGSLELSGGYPEMYGTGANLNYRADKINWFLNYGYRHRTGDGGGKILQISSLEDKDNVTLREFIRGRNGERHSIRFGGDYFITPKQTLTAAFLYRTGLDKNQNSVSYRDISYETAPSKERSFYASLPITTNRIDTEREADNNQEYSLRYDYKINKDHSLKMNLSYQSQEETESSNIADSSTNDQRSSNTEGQNQLRFQTDYEQKFGNNYKVETGTLVSLRNVNNDYGVANLINNTYQNIPEYTDKFDYEENIYALYANIGQEIGNFSYLGGVRYEYSDITTNLQSQNQPNQRKYGQLFPSVFLNYKLPAENKVQLSYSRRINRPRFWDLNPFFTFVDNRNYFSGNPNVNPAYTNSFELGHIKYWENLNFGTTVYYRKTTDVIRRLKSFTQTDTLTYSVTRPENSGTEDNYGLELISGYSGIKNLRIDASANLFAYNSQSADKTIKRTGESLTASLNFKYSIGRKFNFQVRNNYRAPRKTLQGNIKSVLSTNLALSQDFLGDKLTLTLSVRDLFNTRRRIMEFELPNYYENMNFQWRSRRFNATLTYRINQKKKRGKPRGGRPDGDGGDM